jgi:CRP-like cAMP-binding protein
LLKTTKVGEGLGLGRLAQPADMDALVGLVPPLATLSPKEREDLLSQTHVLEAPKGANIIRHGETGDAAYFILKGSAAAGISSGEGNYRSLSTMKAGDFFGEIAALTGTARTADVVAAENSSLLRIPAQALRSLMTNPAVSALLLTTMTERLNRSNLNELPRFISLDQKDAIELRTEPVKS